MHETLTSFLNEVVNLPKYEEYPFIKNAILLHANGVVNDVLLFVNPKNQEQLIVVSRISEKRSLLKFNKRMRVWESSNFENVSIVLEMKMNFFRYVLTDLGVYDCLTGTVDKDNGFKDRYDYAEKKIKFFGSDKHE